MCMRYGSRCNVMFNNSFQCSIIINYTIHLLNDAQDKNKRKLIEKKKILTDIFVVGM